MFSWGWKRVFLNIAARLVSFTSPCDPSRGFLAGPPELARTRSEEEVNAGLGEGQLEERCLERAGLHQEVVGVDQALLGAGGEEVLRVANDELVERRGGRDEDRDRAGTAARPAQLLPGRGDGPRVPDQDRR